MSDGLFLCRCSVQTLASTSVTISTTDDGLTSTEYVTHCDSFSLTDTDTARNLLPRSLNDCGSCWRCCQNRAHLGSTQVHCSSCTAPVAAETVHRFRRPRRIICPQDRRQLFPHFLAEEVNTKQRRCCQLFIHLSTFE